ncbi:DNA polymerase IV [Thiomonas sp. FB-Cd]|uniref:DNA polymerase IV n=1 Tax=Thiomonas sp. FB-Cd TaxID=1158292 RepID=UPI0004DEFE49|nr:DNA polymerase IV [Thiomonas sp. FB-Cd]
MNTRRIAHLDMDAFFASVELLRYPELRGHPVVVGGRHDWHPVAKTDGTRRFARLREYAGRGVVTTSTYEARALGVFSGMGMMKAAVLAPEAYLLPANFEAYRHYSKLFKEAVATVAPEIEDRGIDEIYCDLSLLPDDTLALAHQIKQAVREATGLSCSIGITPNKLLSKIASELHKPDGITVLSLEDVPTRIWPLLVSKVNGIGPKATLKLEGLGIRTIGELAMADAGLLQRHFGATYATWLRDVAQGIDHRPVVTQVTRKSISRETTFERDLHPLVDRAELSAVFAELCKRVAADLQRKGLAGRTIGIKVRFEDFRTVTRDVSLITPTADARTIQRAARMCLKRIELQQRLRLLGIRAGGLAGVEGQLEGDRNPPQQMELLGIKCDQSM